MIRRPSIDSGRGVFQSRGETSGVSGEAPRFTPPPLEPDQFNGNVNQARRDAYQNVAAKIPIGTKAEVLNSLKAAIEDVENQKAEQKGGPVDRLTYSKQTLDERLQTSYGAARENFNKQLRILNAMKKALSTKGYENNPVGHVDMLIQVPKKRDKGTASTEELQIAKRHLERLFPQIEEAASSSSRGPLPKLPEEQAILATERTPIEQLSLEKRIQVLVERSAALKTVLEGKESIDDLQGEKVYLMSLLGAIDSELKPANRNHNQTLSMTIVGRNMRTINSFS